MSLFQILPVEILYYILDKLDAQTILISFRNTCRQFRAIANSYDRYVLNFESITKPDFELLCRLSDPHHVISLTISENHQTLDQIKLFLSRFNLQQFTRLRSLNLYISEECQLKTILERSTIPSLKSFSLKIKNADDRRKTTTAKLLSIILKNSNLSKLHLHIQDGRFEKILWPAQCSIHYLEINNIVSFDHICTILRRSPNLRTLVINSFSSLNPNQSISAPFQQLTSLTLGKVTNKIENLEQFLLLIPSLIHFKLIGYGNYPDGNRWESFIQFHLPLLNKFDFFFSWAQDTQQNCLDINQIILSFQTPFWLEHKQWYITCETDIDIPRFTTLYSIPICVPFLAYQIKKTSISTLPNAIAVMDPVNTVKLDLTKLMSLDVEKKENTRKYHLFRKVKTLELEFGTIRPENWIEFVSNLIDLKTIVQLKISSTLLRKCNPYMLNDITNLLKQTCQVSSVDICFGFLCRKSDLTAVEICGMLPLHIKQLAVSIKDLNEVKGVLKQLQHLSSADFFFDYQPSWNEITKWLDDKRKNSSYQADSFSVCVWLGKNTNEMKLQNNKRFKLTDEFNS